MFSCWATQCSLRRSQAGTAFPSASLLQYWARQVEAAQAPNPLSTRDGRLLRPVPAERRLGPTQLQGHLEEALFALQDEVRRRLFRWNASGLLTQSMAVAYPAERHDRCCMHLAGLKPLWMTP